MRLSCGRHRLPPRRCGGRDPAKELEAARDALSKDHKLRRDRALTAAGQPARESVVEQSEGAVPVRGAIFTDTRFYQMVVVTVAPGATADRVDTRHFIDFFRLVTSATP